jgi:hypothetical protein
MVNMGTKLYSKVPNKIKDNRFFSFQKYFKSFLLKHYLYMVNEFVSLNRVKQADAHVLMFGHHDHYEIYIAICVY